MRALVTGAGRRLGRAMALSLAKAGYDVAIHYVGSEDEAEAVASDIRALGQNAVTLQADMLSDAETETLVSKAQDSLGGPLSVLINNASIFEYDTLATATRDSWDRHMQSNLRAPFILSQRFAEQAPKAVLDDMSEPVAQACIINMIDQRVRKLTPEFMTYTLAKSALWTLTQTSAQALAPDIRVNAIGPGPTLQGARQTESHFMRQRQATVLNRGINPGDITDAMHYLIGGSGITGQLICVDGGQHLGWQTPDVLGPE